MVISCKVCSCSMCPHRNCRQTSSGLKFYCYYPVFQCPKRIEMNSLCFPRWCPNKEHHVDITI